MGKGNQTRDDALVTLNVSETGVRENVNKLDMN